MVLPYLCWRSLTSSNRESFFSLYFSFLNSDLSIFQDKLCTEGCWREEKQASCPSQGKKIHLGTVRVEQEAADWQRTSSGTNPSDGLCTNLTD